MDESIIAHVFGKTECRNHAPADGFAMQEVLVAGLRLQGVADGVAEVQNPALATLAFVRAHHVGLHFHTLDDQLLQQLASRRNKASPRFSISSKIFGLRMTPYFMASNRPERYSRSRNVASTCGSASTTGGW